MDLFFWITFTELDLKETAHTDSGPTETGPAINLPTAVAAESITDTDIAADVAADGDVEDTAESATEGVTDDAADTPLSTGGSEQVRIRFTATQKLPPSYHLCS